MKRTYALVRYGIAATAVAAFVGLLLDTGSPAETAKPMHLRLAYSAITVNQAIPWISYEAGHFKKYGLDVDLVFFQGGTQGVQSLISGGVQIIVSSGSEIAAASVAG